MKDAALTAILIALVLLATAGAWAHRPAPVPQIVPDNSRLVDELLTLPAMYGSHRGKPDRR